MPVDEKAWEEHKRKMKWEIMILDIKILLIEGVFTFILSIFLLGVIIGFSLLRNPTTFEHGLGYSLLIVSSIYCYRDGMEEYYKMRKGEK